MAIYCEIRGTTLYVGGGIGFVARASGTPVYRLMVHPHYSRWLELGALVSDGVAFSRAHAQAWQAGRPMPRSPNEQRGSGSRSNRGSTCKPGEDNSGSEPKGNSKREKDAKKEKTKDKKSGKDSGGGVGELSAPLVAEPESDAADVGTAAGDGGRWVHVPA